MSDKTKLGVELDAALWQEFRNDVKDRRGRVRGVLGEEVETALRERLYDEGEAAIKEDIARVEQKLDAVLADGVNGDTDGGALPSRSNELRARPESDDSSGADGNGAPDEPPHPSAARLSKAKWVAAELDGQKQVTRQQIHDLVDGTYSFGEKATEQLVDAAFTRLTEGRELHPYNDDVLMQPETAEHIEERELGEHEGDDEGDDVVEDPEAEADDTLDDIDDAEPATDEGPTDDYAGDELVVDSVGDKHE